MAKKYSVTIESSDGIQESYTIEFTRFGKSSATVISNDGTEKCVKIKPEHINALGIADSLKRLGPPLKNIYFKSLDYFYRFSSFFAIFVYLSFGLLCLAENTASTLFCNYVTILCVVLYVIRLLLSMGTKQGCGKTIAFLLIYFLAYLLLDQIIGSSDWRSASVNCCTLIGLTSIFLEDMRKDKIPKTTSTKE